jgi:group I intron endonuclease
MKYGNIKEKLPPQLEIFFIDKSIRCGVYRITNNINNKCYIGQSSDIRKRWMAERKCITNHPKYDTVLYRAFRKYGLANFTWTILEDCDKKQLSSRESYWADYYNSYIPNGYNVAKCGQVSRCCCPDKIQKIIELLRQGKSNYDIAIKYNISDQTVSNINWGKSWKQPNIIYPIRIKSCEHNKIDTEECKINKQIALMTKQQQLNDKYFQDINKIKSIISTNITNISAISCKLNMSITYINRLINKYSMRNYLNSIRKLNIERKKAIKLLNKKNHRGDAIIVLDGSGDLKNKIFSCEQDAEIYFNKKGHIAECCNGKRNTCFGYHWAWFNKYSAK